MQLASMIVTIYRGSASCSTSECIRVLLKLFKRKLIVKVGCIDATSQLQLCKVKIYWNSVGAENCHRVILVDINTMRSSPERG